MKFLKSLLPVITAGLFAAGISIVFNSDVGRATFYKWSQTANTNATADATINWAEGMAPSAVNDSARAMMAATAKFRDDTSGKLVLGGTSIAYTVSSNQVFSSLALMDGAELAFRIPAATTSGASPTLNVDALGAKALNQATGVAVPTGALISGAIYRATYVNATNEWIVNGIAGTIPSGQTFITSSSGCPTGYTLAATNNDRALVMSSSSGGSTGGTTGFSAGMNGSFAGGSTVLTQANMPLYDFFLGTLSWTQGVNSLTWSPTSGTVTYDRATASPTTAQAGGTQAVTNGVTQTPTAATNGVLTGTVGGSVAGTIGGTLSTSGSNSAHTHPNSSIQHVFVIACTKN